MRQGGNKKSLMECGDNDTMPINFSKNSANRLQIRHFISVNSLFKVNTPNPKVDGRSLIVHSEVVNDCFSWLRELSKKTWRYIKTENRFTDQYFSQDGKHIDEIKRKFEKYYSHAAEVLENNVEVDGDYEYFYEAANGRLPNLYRRKVNGSSTLRELVIDQDALSKTTGFISIGGIKVSPSQKEVAVLLDKHGDSNFDCFIFTLSDTKKPKCYHIIQNVACMEWLTLNSLLFTRKNQKSSSIDEVHLYDLKNEKEKSIYKEEDGRFSLHLNQSKSKEVLFIVSSSNVTSEVWYIDPPSEELKLILSRKNMCEAYVDHINECYFNLTLDEMGEYCVKCMHQDDIGKDSWKKMFSKREGANFISDIDLHCDKLVVCEVNDLIPSFHVLPQYGEKMSYDIKVAKTPGVLEVKRNQGSDEEFAFTFTSPITPITSYVYNTSNGSLDVQSSILPSWNSDDYVYYKETAHSMDKTQIPVSVFHKKGIITKEAPMLCHVYGAYGDPKNLRFNQLNAYLLSKGWVITYAHVRGGQEVGRKWYHTARLNGKRKTFEDLESCISMLHSKEISSPELTAISGRSAGGLAVSVLLNEHPDIISAAIMQVPFISVLHSMLSEDAYLTAMEYMEWGNPRLEKIDFDYINSYCPFVNMNVNQKKVATLVTIAINDDRIPYWVPLQWAAKRRHLENAEGESSSNLLCRIYNDGGHFGYDMQHLFQEDAEIVRFLYRSLSLT